MIVLTLVTYEVLVLIAVGLNIYYWRASKSRGKSYLWDPAVWVNFTAMVWFPLQGYKLVTGLL